MYGMLRAAPVTQRNCMDQIPAGSVRSQSRIQRPEAGGVCESKDLEAWACSVYDYEYDMQPRALSAAGETLLTAQNAVIH